VLLRRPNAIGEDDAPAALLLLLLLLLCTLMGAK